VKLLKDLLILIRCFLAPRQPPQRGGFFNGRIHLRRVRLSDILTTFIYTKEKKSTGHFGLNFSGMHTFENFYTKVAKIENSFGKEVQNVRRYI
jgi:hypothetical protein